MLNLYKILKNVLTESVTPNEVNAAIDDKIQVIINYSDEENRAPNKRLIEPYAYGMTKGGNAVLRAYQYEGDTFRGKPKWKMFRLDRIQSWQPTEQHFNASPKERGWQAEDYNEQGDNSMTTVFNQVKFDYDQTTDNPYQKGSQLYNIRKQTDNIKQSKPIKIDQMQDNKPGPVTPNPNSQQIQQSQTQNDFQKMLKRNLEITQKEKEKRGFSLSNKNNPRGPVMTQNDENNEINNTENGSK
jgi:hypothetical protein